ncbi:hypothetical protein Tco_0351930 [Tanacetum coccineum]
MAETTRQTRKRFKDLGIKVKVKKKKAQDQRSYSMKEQAYNKDKYQEQDSRTQCKSNPKKSKTMLKPKLSRAQPISIKPHDLSVGINTPLQERNLRLFQGKSRNVEVVCGIIKDLVRFRLLSLKIGSSYQALEAAKI